MTARRDEVATARSARQIGLGRATQLAADLSAIPGWLQVGDPVRLSDPADQAAAQQAAGLVADLVATHRGVAALDAELDGLDGTRPASAFRFVEWSNWLAGLPDATTLLAQLVPDPRRLFLGAEPAMTRATAQRIVDTVAANGGHVGDGQVFVTNAALADDDVFDLEYTALVRLDPFRAEQSIGVLLPLRLETRFRRPAAVGIRGAADKGVSRPGRARRPTVDPHPARSGPGRIVLARCGGDLSGDAGEAAFRSLASAVGGGRAAYLLRTVPVITGAGTGFVADGAFRVSGVVTDGYRAALPDVLQVWGDTGTGLTLLGELDPEPRRDRRAGRHRHGDGRDAPRPGSREMVDVLPGRARRRAGHRGRGTRRPRRAAGTPGSDALGAAGHRAVRPGNTPVLQALADNGTLAVVTPMSPTNTVAGAPAADLGRDSAGWLQVASTAGSGSANGLSQILTGQPLLDGVPAADTSLLAAVPPLVAALWPVLWQRWLKDVEGLDIDITRMGGWAARVLAPLGPFPAIRVGDVPYGVLPGVDLSNWVSAPGDPVWESAIAAIFGNARAGAPDLIAAWATAGVAGGSAEGADADGLLDIIGRVPTSRQLGSRILPAARGDRVVAGRFPWRGPPADRAGMARQS